MTPPEKKRYNSPGRRREFEVTLSEFSSDELYAEIAHRERNEAGGNTLGPADDSQYSMSADVACRLRTLVLCGQRDAALRELCSELEPWVGRGLLP